MPLDSSYHASSVPRNAEIIAARSIEAAARADAKQKAEAFDAMHHQLHMVLPYLEQLRDDEARTTRATYKHGVLDALVRDTFAVITKAEACK